MTEKNDRLGALLRDAYQGITRRFALRTQAHGLSPTQWRLLGQVLKTGPKTQAALAEALDVEPISVSRLVDRMVQAGWVRREAHPQDRRAKVIVPTPKAEAAAPEVLQVVDEVTEAAMARLSLTERDALIRMLRQIIETLGGPEANTPKDEHIDE